MLGAKEKKKGYDLAFTFRVQKICFLIKNKIKFSTIEHHRENSHP
jgi:hypothetical protein